MAKIHIYQQLNLKNKLSKDRDRIMDTEIHMHFGGCQRGGGCGEMGKEVRD